MTTSRYFARGTSEIHFLPAVANTAAPTAPEIAAGVDLTEQVAELSGWDFSGSRIQTPNLKDRFTPQITGEDTVSNSEITFYDETDVDTIRDAVAKNTVGYMLFMDYGPGTGKRAEVWHVESQSVSQLRTVGNEAARFKAAFAVLDPPEQEAVLP